MAADPPKDEHGGQWTQAAVQLLALWREFRDGLAARAGGDPQAVFQRLSQVLGLAAGWLKSFPLGQLRPPPGFMEEAEALWAALGSEGGAGSGNAAPLRQDPRFADPLWREQPLFAFLHQTYLLLCDQLSRAAEAAEGLDERERERLQFALHLLTECLSPANFPLTNPLVIARATETGGESLVRGIGRLFADLSRGQLAHSDTEAMRLGEQLGATPGKVVFETPLFQLIQYAPATERVLGTPLVIFPAWFNRHYLFDLEPEHSFVRWAASEGLTTFVVSWKSADESMGDVAWDDYIAAELQAVDHVRARLAVPSVHALGQGVGGTSLAALLAILAARGEADRVKSATLLSAPLDFAEAGMWKALLDDAALEAIAGLSPKGCLDGRYLAPVFDLLRPGEGIRDHAIRHYLLGEDLPASAILRWRDDVPNVPAKWLAQYLRDLCRDNRLIEPGALTALGTPIDLARIMTPRYVLAGEDMEAPPQDPRWLEWLRAQSPADVPARGKRMPGGKGDKAIEDAPGRYALRR